MVDWRAPVAEPFYRATGRDPMGIGPPPPLRRRGPAPAGHRGRTVRRGPPRRRPRRGTRRLARRRTGPASSAATPRCWRRSNGVAPARSATSSPPSRANRTRSSVPRRPACSSCRAVPAPARPSWPCTARRTCSTRTGSRSKTRACSSSAPTACSCATSSGCCRRSARPASSRSCSPISCPDVQFLRPGDDGDDSPAAARLKGDPRMSDVIDQAISDRQRPLRDDLVAAVPHRLRAAPRRRVGADRANRAASVPPPQRRPPVRRVRGVGGAGRHVGATTRSAPAAVRDVLRGTDEVREALDRMWPVLTPAQLLHDLFGSKALLKSAGRGVLDDDEALHAVPRALRVGRRRAVDRGRRRAARRCPRRARPEARQERQGRRARRDPHLRPHRDRRGAGPHADAAARWRRVARSAGR